MVVSERLTSDGRFNYTWDGENRLKQVESLTSTSQASKRRVVWEYDGQGRRIRQTIYTGASGSYVVTSDLKLLNDGWRCVAELNATNNALVRAYTWGLDLSGSLDGAGGVGGLLLTRNADLGTRNFAAYDGNGNVVALVSAGDGTVTANYEYDPFGQTIRMSGVAAKDNPWRFSTKRVDNETDLVWYEYRAYSPSLGRWLSRDPIGEEGGRNLYGMVGNDGINNVDDLGLAVLSLQEVVDRSFNNWPAGIRPDINECVMTALLWKESNFKTDALNKNANGTYDKGIAQINDVTADDIQDRVGRRFGGSDPFYILARGQRLRDHRFEPDVSIFAAYIYLDDRYSVTGSLIGALSAYGPNADKTLKAANCLCGECGGFEYDKATGRIRIKDEAAAWKCLFSIHR